MSKKLKNSPRGTLCNTFPFLSLHLSLRFLFCLFLLYTLSTALTLRIQHVIYYSKIGKGHVYSNQWRLNCKHRYLSNKRSDYCQWKHKEYFYSENEKKNLVKKNNSIFNPKIIFLLKNKISMRRFRFWFIKWVTKFLFLNKKKDHFCSFHSPISSEHG